MFFTSLLLLLSVAAQNEAQAPVPVARTHPREPMSELFTNNDYPMAAEMFHVTGDVIFRVFVNADGSVRDCRILRQLQIQEFGRVSCEIMRTRAHFVPARDVEGNPVPDTFDGHFIFSSPGPPHNRRRPRH